MSVTRRTVGSLASILGAVGILLSIAGIIGAWVAYVRLIDWLDHTRQRAESALTQVDASIEIANSRLRQTQTSLTDFQQTQAPAKQKGHGALFLTMLEQSNPQIREAREKLVMATEAGIILNGFLETMLELDVHERIGIETEQLRGASNQLSALVTRSEQMTARLPRTVPTDEECAAECTRMNTAVTSALGLLQQGNAKVEEIRRRADEWHTRLRRWCLFGAAVLTVAFLWIGLGQVSLTMQGGAWGWRRLEQAPQAP